MKQILAVALALVLPFFYGCSSPRSQIVAETTDLGIVEVAYHETRHYSLSGGRDCQLTLTSLADGQVLVEVVVLGKDAQGNLRILSRPRMEARSGQRVNLPTGDGSIVLTPRRI